MPKVPTKTSRYREEPVSGPYVINFAPELVNFILSKEKIRTYRFGKERDYLQKGDIVTIKNTDTKGVVGTAIITAKKYTTFGELPLDTPGHEIYENKEHQRDVFSGYYAFLGRKIKDNDLFLVFDFQLQK